MTTAWTIRGGRLVEPAPLCLIGIVNITPDSFYDGGRYMEPDKAIGRALELLDEGAGMLDFGAESTRPGASPLGDTVQEAAACETARLLPVLSIMRAERPDALFSVDTCHAITAAKVLEAGADVINDVSACERDPALIDVLAQFKPGYVLMHGGDRGGSRSLTGTETEARDEPITARVLDFFERKLKWLTDRGVPENRIVLDPGIGFGKTNAESLTLLRDVGKLFSFGRPVYMALSMKSLFGDMLGLATAERGEATRIATVMLAERGVLYHRLHEVAAARRALSILGWFA